MYFGYILIYFGYILMYFGYILMYFGYILMYGQTWRTLLCTFQLKTPLGRTEVNLFGALFRGCWPIKKLGTLFYHFYSPPSQKRQLRALKPHSAKHLLKNLLSEKKVKGRKSNKILKDANKSSKGPKGIGLFKCKLKA